MIGLLGLIVVLAVHSLTLPGAGEGVKFYLLPDFDKVAEQGFGTVITAAMNQAFFTLSLGIAAMQIFGSYMSKEHTLAGESIQICCLDTFVALMSGLIIFPACFSFGVQPDAGPPLIFITLPKVFVNMSGGRDVLDIEDFIVSNLLLPLGSLIYLLFCVTKWGWGFDQYLEEANTGKGIKMPRALKPYFQFVLPILILVILIQGLL